MKNYNHPIPPRRKRRRQRIWTIIGLLAAFVMILVLSEVLFSEKPEVTIREDRLMSSVHVLDENNFEITELTATIAPEELETGTLYPVPLGADLQEYIINTADSYGVDPAIVLGMIAVETGGTWDATLIGDNGHSYGLMQIYATYHTERCIRLNATNLFDPYQNVLVGIDLLAELSEDGQPIEWVLMAYNGGTAYADRMTEQGEISRYAMKVLTLADVYREATE